MTLRLPPMTWPEFCLSVMIEAPHVRMLPDGGYLKIAPLLLGQWQVCRSEPGDFYGWREEWMFSSMGDALIGFVFLSAGAPPQNWTRHRYLDPVTLESRLEYPTP